MTSHSLPLRVQRCLNCFSRCLQVQCLENQIKPLLPSMTAPPTVKRSVCSPLD
ncbi:similar to Fras1 related extracellular matrix protein 1 (predicted) [Rattus norvegicus]|uniref:Similar to Fras1 related extracellular matrix protein 1 (Predicted) n=1 Tax=Rattus norvegicus TaxID=10116 RepID=A6IYH4_RAT|nr:similar to Fras1 related extracellular matrix protein 1 (predicted) [Rattus norvegicus]